MRATLHNGRKNTNGTYSAKHNDRNFDINNSRHIDKKQQDKNSYWHCYKKAHPSWTFEDVEHNFYECHFGASLSERNKRYKQQRHPERIRTIDEYRTSEKTCPEETILQIGKDGDTIDRKLLLAICNEHINWEINTFPNVKVLTVALHCDEEGAPHIHERKVWIGHDKDGLEVVSQSKALEEMGIGLPDPSQKKSKYNNPKMVYTSMCRDHLLEVCRKHGLEIEKEPQAKSKTGLSLDEYKAQQEQEKAEQARQEAEHLRVEIEQNKRKLEEIKKLKEFCNKLQMKDGKTVLECFEEQEHNRDIEYTP